MCAPGPPGGIDKVDGVRLNRGAGAGWVMREGTFDADDMAPLIMRLRYQTEELEHAAAAALRIGRPDAAQRLAAEIERLVRPFGDSRPMDVGKEEA